MINNMNSQVQIKWIGWQRKRSLQFRNNLFDVVFFLWLCTFHVFFRLPFFCENFSIWLMNKSNFASYQAEKPQIFFSTLSSRGRESEREWKRKRAGKKARDQAKKKTGFKWRFPVFWYMLKYADFRLKRTNEREWKKSKYKLWSEFEVGMWVCLRVTVVSVTAFSGM